MTKFAQTLDVSTGDVVVVALSEHASTSPLGSRALGDAGLSRELIDQQLLGREVGSSVLLPAARNAPWSLVHVVRTRDLGSIDAIRDCARVSAGALPQDAHCIVGLTDAAPDLPAAARACLDGWADFSYRRHEPGDRVLGDRPRAITLVDPRAVSSELDAVAARSSVLAAWSWWVRDLVNAPGRDLTPQRLADVVLRTAEQRGVAGRVCLGGGAQEGSWDAVSAVGAASDNEPYVVELTYDPTDGDQAPVALVGKGVTFDSGGLDLKTLDQQLNMKQDMAGAAVVAAAVFAAAELTLPVRIVAVLALAENMLSGRALRPGDIVRHADGTTTEVISPDAEGRLLLADALLHVQAAQPRAIVDVATLTGGGGLGPDLWALISNHDELAAELLSAGARAGDVGWRLPLHRQYRSLLDSPVADRRNLPRSTRYPLGTVAAAVYLEQFVGERSWAHLDISAAAGRLDGEPGPVGATGRPLAALVDWLATR